MDMKPIGRRQRLKIVKNMGLARARLCSWLVGDRPCIGDRRWPAPPSPFDRQAVPAPIDGLDVRVLESNPRAVHVQRTGGPAQRLRGKEPARVEPLGRGGHRDGAELDADGQSACTLIYGSYELSINLGSDFRPGTTYQVTVNDKATTFLAQ